MRFNALGPLPPKARSFVIPGITSLTPTSQALLLSIGIIVAAILIRVAVVHVVNANLLAERARLQRAQQQIALVQAVQTELNGYESFAKEYGKVRDSGYVVAKDLVRLGSSWPNPQQARTSLECLTPSEDGRSFTITGVGKDYNGYAAAVHSVNSAGYVAIPLNQQDKGGRQEFTLRVTKPGAQ